LTAKRDQLSYSFASNSYTMSVKMKLGIIALSSLSLFAASCGDGANNDQASTADTAQVAPPAKEITLAPIPASPEFDGAELSIASVAAEAQGADSAKLNFSFGVKNYELKSQTADAGAKQCNNSDKGQHIHFILDNNPYAALYEPKHSVTLPVNSEHYLMVFLSRSYHESVKTKGAAVVYHFKIDEKGKLQKLDEPKTPMVFYSRPKGDYLGKDTENVLLDFYVWNASLGADYKVNAKINSGGAEKLVDVTEWKPQFLQGLAMGKSSITLTLMDKDGKAVEGPMTNVTREFNLSADEPIK
jgi:hypothetical protein